MTDETVIAVGNVDWPFITFGYLLKHDLRGPIRPQINNIPHSGKPCQENAQFRSSGLHSGILQHGYFYAFGEVGDKLCQMNGKLQSFNKVNDLQR